MKTVADVFPDKTPIDRTSASGPVVMTERVDVFTLAGKTFDLQIMGAFEVNDGKINAWRDYFDPSQFNS